LARYGPLAAAGLNKSELAKKMGVTKAYITQLLSGTRNMTLHMLAVAAFHCGQKIDIRYELLDPARKLAAAILGK
jgi:transcriptional regulator with XRE-family HTH domain